MSDTSRQILFALVAPLVLGLAIAGLLRRRRPAGSPPGAAPGAAPDARARGDRAGRVRVVLALALPMILAFVGLSGWPREQWQSMMWVPVVGAVIGAAMASGAGDRLAIRTTLIVLLATLATAVVWPVIGRETATWWIGTALCIALLASALEPLAARRPGPLVPAALALSAATTAGIVLWSAGSMIALPVIALAVALAATALVAFRHGELGVARGPVAVVAPVLVIAPVVAWLYMSATGSTLPIACFLLPAVAPIAVALTLVPGVRDRSPWLRGVIGLVPVVVLCAAAAVLAAAGDGGDPGLDPEEEMYRQMMGG